MKVLIVDDNFNDRTGVYDLVRWNELGIDEVFCASNGKEGLELAIKLEPTLVLTDVSMPIMDGIKMAQNISKVYPNTKFIFFSCFDDVEYLTAAIDARAYGYLLKPIDIDLLEQTITKVLQSDKLEKEQNEELSILKTRLNEYTPVVRTAIFRDFLTGAGKCTDNTELFQFSENGYFTLGILCIDESERAYSQIYEINDSLSGFNQEETEHIAFVMGSNYLVVAVHFKNTADEVQRIDNTISFFEALRDYLKKETVPEVNICIGGVTDNLKQLPTLFRNCEYALKSGGVYSGITFAEERGKQIADFNCDLSELKERMITIVEEMDILELDSFMEEYYGEQFFDSNYTPQIFGFVVLSVLQMILSEKNISFSDIFTDGNLVWNKLLNYKSIYNVKNWMYNIFKSVIEYQKQSDHSQMNQNNQNQIVEQIKKMIAEELCEIESISSVTKKLFISTSYANHLFKQQEGKTIFEYLSEQKLETAKAMLRNDELKIYEIADRLGYKTNSYFGVVFKDKVGMTPRKYRDTYGIKKE